MSVFGGSFVLGRAIGLSCAETSTPSSTATGDDVELAVAVAIGTFGVTSGQALAGVVGPLVEVPVLVALVHTALWAGRRSSPGDPTVPPPQSPGMRPLRKASTNSRKSSRTTAP